MAEQKKKEREEFYQKIGINPDDSIKMPISSKWKEIQEREQEQQKLKEFFEGEVKERINRKLKYAEVVKKDYWPEISQKKKQEIIDIKAKLKSGQSRHSSKALTDRQSYSVMTGSIKDEAIHSESVKSNKTPIKNYYRYRPKKKREKLIQETPHDLLAQRENSKIQKSNKEIKDYLRELRTQREENEGHRLNKNPLHDWRSLNSSAKYDNLTKINMIKEKSKYIDSQIEMKERSMHFAKAPLTDTNNLNSMIVNSIEAKLTVLKGLSEDI